MKKAIALLEEFADSESDIVSSDGCILFTCRKKYMPEIYPRMANLGFLLTDIELGDSINEYMNVRFYYAFKHRP